MAKQVVNELKWSIGVKDDSAPGLNSFNKNVQNAAKESQGFLARMAATARANRLEQRQSGETALQSALSSPMGMTGFLADSAGVGMQVMVAGVIARQLAGAAAEAEKVVDQFRAGEMTWEQLYSNIGKTIPILGDVAKAGESITNMITGWVFNLNQLRASAVISEKFRGSMAGVDAKLEGMSESTIARQQAAAMIEYANNPQLALTFEKLNIGRARSDEAETAAFNATFAGIDRTKLSSAEQTRLDQQQEKFREAWKDETAAMWEQFYAKAASVKKQSLKELEEAWFDFLDDADAGTKRLQREANRERDQQWERDDAARRIADIQDNFRSKSGLSGVGSLFGIQQMESGQSGFADLFRDTDNIAKDSLAVEKEIREYTKRMADAIREQTRMLERQGRLGTV